MTDPLQEPYEAALEVAEYSGEKIIESRPAELRHMPLAEIVPGNNPRRKYEAQAMRELVSSIKSIGLIQPIVVRPATQESGGGDEVPHRYIIIAGERRYRAAKLAGLEEVPVTIRFVTEIDALEMTMAENLDREQLDAIEEARGLQDLLHRGRTQEQLADRLHKSQSWIANRLRLLKLPIEVQDMIADKQLAPSFGVSLISIENYPAQISDFARKAYENSWSIKEIDAQVAQFKRDMQNHRQPRMSLDDDIVAIPVSSPEDDGTAPGYPPDDDEPGDDPGDDPGDEPPAEEAPADEDAGDSTAKFVPPGPAPAREVESAPVSATVPTTSLVSKQQTPQPEAPKNDPPKSDPPKPATSSPAAPRPASPTPAPAPAKPSLPPGMVEGLLKKEDLDALQSAGLWPLAKVREEIERLKAGNGEPEEAAAPAAPTPSLSDALMSRSVVIGALKLAEANRTTESVFTPRETEILEEMYPKRETTTPAMIIAVLVEARFRVMQKATAAMVADTENAKKIEAEQAAEDQDSE